MSTRGRTCLLTEFAILVAIGPAAYADPIEFQGHHYEIIPANAIPWSDAESAAEGKEYAGVPGHLATITSPAENAFLHGIRTAAALTSPEVWVGGFQPPGSPEPAWRWVNSEGSIPGAVSADPYANWTAGEPNNTLYTPEGEDHLAMGLGGASSWNDEGSLGNIGGYIVEYDTEIVTLATDCLATGPGFCNPTGGQKFTLPAGVQLDPGDTIGFSTFEFTDERCNGLLSLRSPLVLFGGDLIIPPYLCGSPKFVVIKTTLNGFDEIQKGVVLVENLTSTLLPDNLYDCQSPIPQSFPTAGDPQYQDVVVWQATNRATMLENGLGGGVFAGAAGEFTNGCGSSRGSLRGASYFVVGLHVDFGPGFEWAQNTAGNHDMFVALTRYKLTLLQAAVEDANADKALKNGDYKKLQEQVVNAIKQIDRNNPRGALVHVRNFLKFAEKASYASVPGKNHSGEHLMRGQNIEFTLTNKVIPY